MALVTIATLKKIPIEEEFKIFASNRTADTFDKMIEDIYRKWINGVNDWVREHDPTITVKLLPPFEALAKLVNISSEKKLQEITTDDIYSAPISANVYSGDSLLFSIRQIPKDSCNFVCNFAVATDSPLTEEKAAKICDAIKLFLTPF